MRSPARRLVTGVAALATVAPVTPAVDSAAPVVWPASARRGVLRLRVSEPGQVTISARRAGGGAVRTRVVAVHAGANAVALRRWLGAGRFRVALVVADAAGNRSAVRRLRLAMR